MPVEDTWFGLLSDGIPLFFHPVRPPVCYCYSRPAAFLKHQALSHPDEVWGVSPSPTDASLLVTCSNGARAGQADGAASAGFKVPGLPCDFAFRRCVPLASDKQESATYDQWFVFRITSPSETSILYYCKVPGTRYLIIKVVVSECISS